MLHQFYSSFTQHIKHTFCSAMRFNSLTTACTVAVFPVPGTPEMSVEDDQFITSSLTTERGQTNSQMHPPLPSSSNSSTACITHPYSSVRLRQSLGARANMERMHRA